MFSVVVCLSILHKFSCLLVLLNSIQLSLYLNGVIIILRISIWIKIKLRTKFRAWLTILKGNFPQTTKWIGWVESNFRNPTVYNFEQNLDNPFKRANYAKFCMSPSLDRTLPEYVIPQENNSSLTLYRFSFSFLFNNWISVVRLIKFNHECTHNHLIPNIPKYKSRMKMYFHEK